LFIGLAPLENIHLSKFTILYINLVGYRTWCHNNQHNDTQHKDTQHNSTQ
jgi:hypothetical protein